VAVSNLMRLLDLPDEALELLEQGVFSEGHGRALLLAKDHGARRKLARSASGEGWSVRTTEERARLSNERGDGGGPAKERRSPAGRAHPDQEAAAGEIETALGEALGAEVKARPAPGGGFRVELSFDSREEALELAERLGARVSA
jgi:ParB family chromosome partitioning protein